MYNHCAVSYIFFTLSEHTASTTGGCVFILSNVSAWATHRKKLRESAEWASYPHCTCSLWSEGYMQFMNQLATGYMQFMNQLATVYMQFTFYGKCKIHVCICTNKGKSEMNPIASVMINLWSILFLTVLIPGLFWTISETLAISKIIASVYISGCISKRIRAFLFHV